MKRKSGLSVLFSFMRGNKLNYLLAISATIVFSMLSLIPAYLMGGTIDSILGGREYASELLRRIFTYLGGRDHLIRNLYLIGVLLISANIISGLFSYTKAVFSNRSSERIAKRIRDMLFEHLQNLTFSYHSRADKGDLIQRCTSDIETIRSFLSSQLVEVAGALFSIGFVFYTMSSLSPRLTIAAVSVIPVIFVVSFIFYQKIKKAYRSVEEAEAVMSNVVQENVNGVRVVKAFGQEINELEKFDKSNNTFYQKSLDFMKVSSMFWAVTDFLSMFQIAVLVVTGVIITVNGNITVGILATFISYEWMILWPVRQLGRILGDLGKTTVSVERIREVLDVEIEDCEDECVSVPKLPGDIVFDDVSFSYSDGTPVLKNISFTLPKGSVLGVMGPTGSGKSTLIHLLQRLFDYTKGKITISGVELKDINRKWIRQKIGLVLQEPFLFSKTIRDNIALAHMDADDQAIEQAAKTAVIHEVITRFDHGYQTLVGEKGVTLSGGQKQRMAIARTVIREKPILIFDDSLSAVDSETDAAIRQELSQNATGATKIIISHRINSLKDADMILVIEDGEITQKGTHKSLLDEPGLYRRIFDVQNSLNEDLAGEVV